MFSVAQIFNLLYRRFSIGKVHEDTGALEIGSGKQNTILRYSAIQQIENLRYVPDAKHVPGGEGWGEEAIQLPRLQFFGNCSKVRAPARWRRI